jgi:hypothetical protein
LENTSITNTKGFVDGIYEVLLTGAIGAAGTIGAAIAAAKLDKKVRRLESEANIERISRKAASCLDDFLVMGSLYRSVKDIFKSTRADRFLIMIAVNGRTDFKHVTVIYQQFDKYDLYIDAMRIYKNMEIDAEYKKMLREARMNGTVLLDTNEMPDQIIKDIYLDEGVWHSKVKMMAKKSIDEDNDMLIFTSIATHNIDPYTNNELRFISTVMDNEVKPAIEKLFEITDNEKATI